MALKREIKIDKCSVNVVFKKKTISFHPRFFWFMWCSEALDKLRAGPLQYLCTDVGDTGIFLPLSLCGRIYLSLPCAISFLQSESLVVCDVAEDLVEKLRKFRFRKETNNAAIISKFQTCLTKMVRKSSLLFSSLCKIAAVSGEHEPGWYLFSELQHFEFCL